LLYFGNPQCTPRLARKPKLYHHVPENHSPQFGQRQTLSRTPQTTSRAIQTNAATKPGVKVWNNLKDRTAIPKHTGTYVANRRRSVFLIPCTLANPLRNRSYVAFAPFQLREVSHSRPFAKRSGPCHPIPPPLRPAAPAYPDTVAPTAPEPPPEDSASPAPVPISPAFVR